MKTLIAYFSAEGTTAALAEKLAEEINTPVILVGGMRSLDTMEEVLNRSKIEMISLSRPLLREPDLPNRMQRGETDVSRCISCNACYSSFFTFKFYFVRH